MPTSVVLVAVAVTPVGGCTATHDVRMDFEAVMPQPRDVMIVTVSVTLACVGVYVMDEVVVELVMDPPVICQAYVQPEHDGTDAVRPAEQATG
jgi:hypothetical protein